MFYQKLELGDPPYFMFSNATFDYPEHIHVNVELYYCYKGISDIVINKNRYTLKEGELAIIGSMASHEVLKIPKDKESLCLVMGIGPAMLREHFGILQRQDFVEPVYNLKEKENEKLYLLFNEVAVLIQEKSLYSDLIIKGNMYKILGYILGKFISENGNSSNPKKLDAINLVEKSLEIIYNNYQSKITVDDVAKGCGYSKSNFCKIFKSITNDTFHNVLNNHRVKMACILLLNDVDSTIEDIASRVGFADSKSFCRVFKNIKGLSPGKYKSDDTTVRKV